DFGIMALLDDPRVGFFVVARLAHHHGIRVSLTESTYGGVRAGVVIPSALISTPNLGSEGEPNQSDDTNGSTIPDCSLVVDEAVIHKNGSSQSPSMTDKAQPSVARASV